MKKLSLYLIVALALLSGACSVSTPEHYTDCPETACIYPDYTDVTVPRNMAPLHFHIENEGDAFVTTLACGNTQLCFAQTEVCPTPKQWNKLLAEGNEIQVTLYVQRQDSWLRLKTFPIHISSDSIDPYIAYRLIAPSYVTYEDLTICQRNLENYDEEVIYGNMKGSVESSGHCINCHAFQNYNPERMQFHVRQGHGGTVVSYDGMTEKVNLKTDSIISAGVYPAWHPTEKLIAYSTNNTNQAFHTYDLQKVEVQDTYSDLILYDVEKRQVIPLTNDSSQLDCFPWWSPDGKYLYYCSAEYHQTDSSVNRQMDMIRHPEQLHYNLYRRTYDPILRNVREPELVYDAAALGKSATLPRISPDGQWLMFTLATYGVFHIWHTDADLYLMNLKTREVRCMSELNSDQVESYHSWSSNGQWVIFSSRRDDGNFTRPFLAHIDAQGRGSKPFELPTDNPLYHRELLRSYNVPEFITGPVTVTPQEFAHVIQEEARLATQRP